MFRQYYVYILLCSDNSYYVGVTNNIERRLNEHQTGYNATAYTHDRRPVKLVFTQSFQYIDKAIEFEKQVKRWSRAKKEALINYEWEKLPGLAKKKVFKR